MKPYTFLLVLFISFPLYAKDQAELVESIPVETTLGNPDIRNTSEVWIEMINSAKSDLNFAQFYISHKPGEALEPVLSAIIAAADRGVTVRFIVDANMYRTYPHIADELNRHENIFVRVYDLSSITGGVMHAKYFIVDGKEIFLGSPNFDWRALKHIHELGIRISGRKLADFYQRIFDLDWRLSEENADTEKILSTMEHNTEPEIYHIRTKEYGKITVTPTASSPDIMYNLSNWDETQILKCINSASGTIRIQLLSYSPLSRKELYETLDLALRKAAARGVQVQMILSDWNFYSPRIEYIKSLHAIPNIEIKFSTIPEASEGYIGYARVEHCKFMIIDSKLTWLGTSNWSKSYFYNGRNLGIILDNEKLSERITSIFLKSWNSEYCHSVDLGKSYERKTTEE
ncbi:MAG: phospholipase D-like domain-containing protein [Candidatus Marinimicrobia bacterium]|nr:phospholipase D-like domain-containing protein [Candidatus Neomarinimicrobiota bacterium]